LENKLPPANRRKTPSQESFFQDQLEISTIDERQFKNETLTEQMDRYASWAEKYTPQETVRKTSETIQTLTVRRTSGGMANRPIEADVRFTRVESQPETALNLEQSVRMTTQPPMNANSSFTKPGISQSFTGIYEQPAKMDIQTRIATPAENVTSHAKQSEILVQQPSISRMETISAMVLKLNKPNFINQTTTKVAPKTIPNVWDTDIYEGINLVEWKGDQVTGNSNIWKKQPEFPPDFLSIIMRGATGEDTLAGRVNPRDVSVTTEKANLVDTPVTTGAFDWGIATHGWARPTKNPKKTLPKKSLGTGKSLKKTRAEIAKERAAKITLASPTDRWMFEAGIIDHVPQKTVGAPRISEEKRKLQSVTDKLRHAERKRKEAESFAAATMAKLAKIIKQSSGYLCN
jgi:hypothetical protein